MQSIASSRGTAVSRFPWRTARARFGSCSILLWMFSTSTVASSTRMPTARARPPSVIRLTVWSVSQSATTAPQRANGMFSTTTTMLRQSRRKTRTIRPVSRAPKAPSVARLAIAFETVGDWSNSKLTLMSSGRTACIAGSARRTSLTTERVEASARLVTRM